MIPNTTGLARVRRGSKREKRERMKERKSLTDVVIEGETVREREERKNEREKEFDRCINRWRDGEIKSYYHFLHDSVAPLRYALI